MQPSPASRLFCTWPDFGQSVSGWSCDGPHWSASQTTGLCVGQITYQIMYRFVRQIEEKPTYQTREVHDACFRKHVMIALCLVFICIPFLWLRWVKSLSAFLLYTYSHPFICLSSPPKAPFHICIYTQVCLPPPPHTHTHTPRAPECLLNSALH